MKSDSLTNNTLSQFFQWIWQKKNHRLTRCCNKCRFNKQNIKMCHEHSGTRSQIFVGHDASQSNYSYTGKLYKDFYHWQMIHSQVWIKWILGKYSTSPSIKKSLLLLHWMRSGSQFSGWVGCLNDSNEIAIDFNTFQPVIHKTSVTGSNSKCLNK